MISSELTLNDLASKEYRKMNFDLHGSNSDYGGHGKLWLKPVSNILDHAKPTTVLDYGCGKNTLVKHLEEQYPDIVFYSFDPCIPKYQNPPPKCDMVLCLDVMEHVEPNLLENVLAHISYLSKKHVFMVISTKEAKKTLPDGRNAHLIVEKPLWWLKRLCPLWKIDFMIDEKRDEMRILGRK